MFLLPPQIEIATPPDSVLGSWPWLRGFADFVASAVWMVLAWRAMKSHERLPDALAKSPRDAAQAGDEADRPA